MAAPLLEQASFLPFDSPGDRRRDRPGDRRWDRLRVTLLAAWLVLFAGVWLLGEHAVPVSRLDAAVSSGQLSTVRVSPPITARTGTQVQSAHWTVGIHRYVASVRQVAGHVRPVGPPSYPVTRRPLADRLRAEAPVWSGLHVLRTAEPMDPTEMLGRRVPSLVGSARLLLYVVGLVVLAYGPQPWRARRWAWFWLMSVFGLQTLGAVAFLALAGPTPLLGTPRPGRARLRGGWAFVIALVFAGLGGSPG